MGTTKGHNKYIESPEQLYKYFEDYKKQNFKKPQISKHYNVKTDSTGTVKHTKSLTMQGFNVYLYRNNIIKNLYDYINNIQKRYSNYTTIIRMIKDEIFEHNFNGAIVGEYQHNIIARQLGMVDKVESTVKVEPATREEVQKELDELLKRAKDSLK